MNEELIRAKKSELLIWVRAKDFCAGLVVSEGVCILAAPIIEARIKAIGKSADELRAIFRRKRWDARVVSEKRPAA